VGAGDGVRAERLAGMVKASCLVLSEPSDGMHALCLARRADEVWQAPAQALPETERTFDVITCLWNVLGHLPGRDARIAALSGMRRLLTPMGQIFCDVNNRHNAKAYGKARVMLRRFIDGLLPDERRGDATFEWVVAGERIPAAGHLFTPGEMRALVASAGLRVVDELAVDYVTGFPSARPWDGQLLYRLMSRPGAAEA